MNFHLHDSDTWEAVVMAAREAARESSGQCHDFLEFQGQLMSKLYRVAGLLAIAGRCRPQAVKEASWLPVALEGVSALKKLKSARAEPRPNVEAWEQMGVRGQSRTG